MFETVIYFVRRKSFLQYFRSLELLYNRKWRKTCIFISRIQGAVNSNKLPIHRYE